MKILFVHPAPSMSIADVARGYRAALERQGHEIYDYHLAKRYAYHQRAIPPEITDPSVLSRQASETIVTEALCFGAELVIIICGLGVHAVAVWLLGRVDIPIATILTESPYDDEQQAMWTSLKHVNSNVDMTAFTNDRFSAEKYGWHLLRPAYDQNIHKPLQPKDEFVADVTLIGTGWGDRQAFLEAVDWTGINLKIYGIWPELTPDSSIYKFLTPLVVSNETAVEMYCSSKICINFHRANRDALTYGPRVVELAACGAFQLSDRREDMDVLVGDSVPIFRTPKELGDMVRFYLRHPEDRERLAGLARKRVAGQTFDSRAADLIAALAGRNLRREVMEGA